MKYAGDHVHLIVLILALVNQCGSLVSSMVSMVLVDRSPLLLMWLTGLLHGIYGASR